MKATLRFIIGVVHSVGLDEYMMTHSHQYGVVWTAFSAFSKNPPIYSIIFSISRMKYNSFEI